MTRLALVALLALAACGADAPPFVPTGSLGATLTPGGIDTSATLGATNGTISVGINL